MLLWLLSTLVAQALGYGYNAIGTLAPNGETAVSLSINNAGETAAYTFSFVPTTTIPVGGTLTITFPQQYASGLGITGTPSCTGGSCAVSGYSVTITLTTAILSGTTNAVVINSVVNPSAGGTGNFVLTSMYGATILDQNKVFSVVGIAAAVTSLASTSVSLQTGGSSQVGATATYQFQFTTTSIIPAWSWLSFIFPGDGFTLGTAPTCSAMTVSGYTLPGSLVCSSSGNVVTVTGISSDVPATTDLGVSVSVTNPPKAVTTGTFTIEAGRNSTTTVYQRSTGILGVTIRPGSLTSVSLSVVDSSVLLATSKLVLYRLLFTTTNTVSSSGSITITFNNNFNLDNTYTYYIESGLNDLSATSQVTLSYSSTTNVLTITNFATFTASRVSIILQLTNPNTSGATTPLIISTLDSSGNTIDQDTTQASVMIVSTSSPTIATSFYSGTSAASGATTYLQFTITPNVEIPALGYIKIKPTSTFTISSSTLTCLMKPKNVAAAAPNSCTYTGGYITLKLFSTTAGPPAGSGDFVVGVSSYIQLTAGVTAPTLAGNYAWDLTTYDQNMNTLESGTAIVALTANLMTTAAVTYFHVYPSKPTIIKFTFTPLINIPTGAPQLSTVAQGYIQITLDGSRYQTGLGMSLSIGGSVPCRGISGISPSTSGGQILCTYTSHASQANGLVITISQFSAISANTAIELHLAGIYNYAAGSSSVGTITTYSIFNRVIQALNTYALTIPGGDTTAYTSGTAITPALTNSVVSTSPSTLTLPSVVVGVTTGTSVIIQFSPTHDAGYCTFSSITCSVGGTSYPCYCYPTADLVLIELSSALTASTYTFIVNGLVNPASVISPTDGVNLFVCAPTGSPTLAEYYTMNSLATLTAGTFTQSSASSNQYLLNAVNAQYTFAAVPQHAVPTGSSFVLTFPSQINLGGSSPLPTCFSSYLVAQTAAGVSCSVSGNVVTVSNFQALTAGSSILVTVNGVKNPSSGTTTGTFTFSTINSAGRTMDYLSSVAGVTLTGTFAPGSITFTEVLPYPNNYSASSEYRIRLSTSHVIPVGGTLTVTFPSSYGTLSPTDVRLSEAITTYASYVVSGNSVSITMNTALPVVSVVSVSVFGVINPQTATASYFTASSMYDGVTLDSSPSVSSLGQQVAIFAATASSIAVSSVSFYPQNEGEEATYVFTIVPSININTGYSLVITFPQTFDKTVGNSLTCSATGLTGNISCSITNAYELEVTGQNSFTASSSNSIVLTVYGVINPNSYTSATSGNFLVGIRLSQTYSQFNSAAGSVTFIAAPGLNNLLSTSVESLYCRETNYITFNFTTSHTIPRSSYNGAIWVKFPSVYSLTDSTITTLSSSFWANGSPTDTIYNDRILLTGSSSDFVGNMLVAVSGVTNPISQGTSNSIVVETYDGNNLIIVDRSYPNLSPNNFAYVYRGPVINVNGGNPFTVEAGTMSQYLAITLSRPAALNLTLTPYSYGFSFEPYAVHLAVGDVYQTIRISAPAAAVVGSYVATWTLAGDNVPAFYTPVSESSFNVTANGNVQITCDSIVDIPLGASSLPTFVRLAGAPDVGLSVFISVANSATGISVTPANLTFLAGQSEASFIVSVSNSSTVGTASLLLSINGTDSASYSLAYSTVSFNILLTGISLAPTIEYVSANSLTRTTASLVFSTNQVSTIYYAVALKGSPSPSLAEVVAGGPPAENSTMTVYGVTYAGSSYQASALVGNLMAATPYSVYVYATNLFGNTTASPLIGNFTTEPAYSTAYFSLGFTTNYITEADVSSTIAAVGLILSLPSSNVALKTLDNTYGGRRLQGFPDSTLELYIYGVTTSDNYDAPLNQIAYLATQMSVLTSLVSSIDPMYQISGTVVTVLGCSFSTPPVLSTTSALNSIAIVSQLATNGYVYAVAVPASNSSAVPTSMQIAAGTDSRNYVAPSSSGYAYGLKYSNVTISGLESLTDYDVYITCGNDYPGRPELLVDSAVIIANWETGNANYLTPLNLNSAIFLCLWLPSLLLLA